MNNKQNQEIKSININGKKIYSDVFEAPEYFFRNHLVGKNERILFSGKFGKGKTTFLKYFFEKNKNEYNVFHLHPVNYHVLDNVDIFSYLKYDLLYNIIQGREKIYPNTENSERDLIYYYGLFNLDKIFNLLILSIPKIGKQYHMLLEKLDSFKKEFDEFKAKAKNLEIEKVNEFFKTFQQDEGEIYENNFTTKLINEYLNEASFDNKENILIIDDLDRVDPKHIFRLLNIFSSHFDLPYTERKKKFNFDRIILVCHFNNIRSVFHHYYGKEADFSGYINKFYTTEPFHFDCFDKLSILIREELKNKIYLNTKKIKEYDYYQYIFDTLTIIFVDLINQGKYTLREFIKSRFLNLEVRKLEVDEEIYNSQKLQLLFVVDYLMKLFGSIDNCISQIEKLNRKITSKNEKHIEFALGQIIAIAALETNGFATRHKSLSYKSITYSIRRDFQENKVYISTSKQRNFKAINFYEVLIEAINTLRSHELFE